MKNNNWAKNIVIKIRRANRPLTSASETESTMTLLLGEPNINILNSLFKDIKLKNQGENPERSVAPDAQ